MKEKRYFSDWLLEKTWKKVITAIIVSACIAVVIMFLLGDFKNIDYPEDTYKQLEEAYIPYVYKGIGVDKIGLQNEVQGLRETICSDGIVILTYGEGCDTVTVTLDENYNTVSIERNIKTKGEYRKLYVFKFFVILIGLLFVELVFGALAFKFSLEDKNSA